MQAESDAHRHESGDENDSLFGSPPPSPARAGRSRSSSPLAFPGGGSGSDSAQNVGTLALPGSHFFSELPSAYKSVPTVTSVLQQPQKQNQGLPGRSMTGSRSGTASASRVATPLPPPAPRTAAKPRKSSKKAQAGSTPRPTPPPIPLPDPSEPPPSNFLRNQQALLGLAGLVSGVKPANLALQNTRGTTASNPIVVDDEDDRPTIGRHPPAGADGVPSAVNLPVPSSDAILQTLINQKNIFPVVDALLRLASNGSQAFQSQPQYSAFCRPPGSVSSTSTAAPPPAKKRKLSSVPAGAIDWDVPYPFPEGQGPADYRTNWERQRSRQLLVDLIGLVKNAARKAAAKNYYQSLTMQQQQMLWEKKYGARLGSQSHSQPKVYGHYRPETLHYGLPPGQAPQLPPGYVGYTEQGQSSTQANSIATDSQNAGQSNIDLSTQLTPAQDQLSKSPPTSTNPDFSSLPTSHLDTTAMTETTTTSTNTPFEFPAFDATITSNDPSSNDLDNFLALFSNMPPEELEQIFSMPAMDPNGAGSSAGSSSQNEFANFEALMNELSSLDPTGGNRMEVGESSTSMPSTFETTGNFKMEEQVMVDPSVYTMDPSLLAIDPALVALSFPSQSQPDGTPASMSDLHPLHSRSDSQLPQISIQPNSGITTTSNTGAPPTPTLIGSPLSPRALSESDHGPQTPNWDAMFGGDVEIVSETGDSGGQRSSTRGDSVVGDGNDVRGKGGQGTSETEKERIRTGALFSPQNMRKAVLTKHVRFADSLNVGMDVDVNMHLGPSQDKGKGREVGRDSGTGECSMQGFSSGHASSTQSQPSACDDAAFTSTQSSLPFGQATPSHSGTPVPLTFTVSQPSTSARPPSEATSTSPYNPYNPYGNSLFSLAHLTSLAAQSRAKTKNKEEILKRARAMKAQLFEEIQRAKVELWEMTMEAGCLSLLAKEKSLDSIGSGSETR